MDYESLSSEQLALVCCEAREERAWAEFVRRFHPLIASVAFRTARRWSEVSPAILEDLIQEIYLKFCENQCRLLREFKAQHPNAFLGFLKVVAANVVHDHYRAAHSKKRGSNDFVESLGDGDEPAGNRNSGNLTGVDRELLLLEINAALNRATQESEGRRNRLIFWLYYRQGFSAQAIASLPYIGLNTKGVESAILRLTRSVREELAVSNSEQQKTRHADRD